MNIYKMPLLQKLGLSENFSRKMLYSRQSVLGVEIVKLITIIAMEIIKQYIGSMRSQNKVSKMIIAISELETVQYGYNNNKRCKEKI